MGRPGRLNDATPPQPLSAREYIVVSIALFAIALLLTYGLIKFADRMVSSNLFGQFYYLVLIGWGLLSAVVLFGVMRSFAHLTYREVSGAVELGGPAVVALLVVVGGFVLVPRAETFTLTIRPRAPDQPTVSSGQVRIELGSSTWDASVSKKGEADFKDVPQKYRGTTVRVLPMIERYRSDYQSIALDSDAVDLNLTLAPAAESLFVGRLVPVPGGTAIRIVVEDTPGAQTPDDYGKFRVTVARNIGDRIRIQVCADGRTVYDDYQVVTGGEQSISTHQPDGACSR